MTYTTNKQLLSFYQKFQKIIDDLKPLQNVLCDLFKQFIAICDDNNLCWYAAGGTLLGAVRDNGIIPYDDDIDIYMPRKDYDKLMELYDKFQYPYFLQNDLTEKNWNSIRKHAQLRRSNTTGFIEHDRHLQINKGIFIDIFPLDELRRGFYNNGAIPMAKLETPKRWWKNIIRTKFEDFTVNVPAEYNNILVTQYGINWNIPTIGENIHGKITWSTTIPYTEFKY